MERNPVGMRAMVGRGMGLLGVVFAVVGISIEFPGIIFGGLGYYFGLTSQDRMGQILGISAAVLSLISIGISGLETPPQ